MKDPQERKAEVENALLRFNNERITEKYQEMEDLLIEFRDRINQMLSEEG